MLGYFDVLHLLGNMLIWLIMRLLMVVMVVMVLVMLVMLVMLMMFVMVLSTFASAGVVERAGIHRLSTWRRIRDIGVVRVVVSLYAHSCGLGAGLQHPIRLIDAISSANIGTRDAEAHNRERVCDNVRGTIRRSTIATMPSFATRYYATGGSHC